MAMYGSASRLRFPNRDKPAATRIHAVKSAAGPFEIAPGNEQARVAAYDRSHRDAQLGAGLARSISGDNQRGQRRSGDGNSIRREVLLRFVSRPTNTGVGELFFWDRWVCNPFAVAKPGGAQ